MLKPGREVGSMRAGPQRATPLAGAEAISVNGERITPTSSLLDIGTSILVNSAYLAPPYQITAIGPKDLYDRLVAAPEFSDFIRARADAYGIRVSFAEPSLLDPVQGPTVLAKLAEEIAAMYCTPSSE